MEANGEVEQGKFLRIRVEGKEGYLKAYLNKYKSKDSDADFKGEGVLVWVNQARPESEDAGQTRQSELPRQTEMPRQQHQMPQRRW